MSDIVFIVVGCVLSLILGVILGFFAFSIKLFLQKKKVPKDIKELIAKSKTQKEEVKNARADRDRKNAERKRADETGISSKEDRRPGSESATVQPACLGGAPESERRDKHDTGRPRRI